MRHFGRFSNTVDLLSCAFMREEEEAFLSTFITVLQQGTFVSPPSLSRLEVQITRGLQKLRLRG